MQASVKTSSCHGKKFRLDFKNARIMIKMVNIIILVLNLWAMEANAMKILSDAFSDQGEIPSLYTCEGRNISPPLSWSNLPDGTKSLALIVDDPDAPDPAAPKLTWVHWVLYNIDPSVTHLEENMTPDTLPNGIKSGTTNWDNTLFGGPCPPIGRHRYFHKLYALDTVLPDLKEPTKDALLQAMQGHVIAEAILMGTYQKENP